MPGETPVVWLWKYGHDVRGLGSGIVNDNCVNFTVSVWVLNRMLRREQAIFAPAGAHLLLGGSVCCRGGLQPCCHWFSSESSLFFWGDSAMPYFPLIWGRGRHSQTAKSKVGCTPEPGVNWKSQWQFVWLRTHWAFLSWVFSFLKQFHENGRGGSGKRFLPPRPLLLLRRS